MKKEFGVILVMLFALLVAAGAGEGAPVAGAGDMASPAELSLTGLQPVGAECLQEGNWPVEVLCSSSMFRIEGCELAVSGGKLTVRLMLGGKGYLWAYPGTGKEASEASQDTYLSCEPDATGAAVLEFTIPALDAPVNLAAFSRKREKWYDRTLVFRSDSLPLSAFREEALVTAGSLHLEPGTYMCEISLSGGSGRASVSSPAELVLGPEGLMARIVWSSDRYDYMRLGETVYPAQIEDGHSVCTIPVSCLDRPLPVLADTTAMSTPHEIAYTLTFSSQSLQRMEVP